MRTPIIRVEEHQDITDILFNHRKQLGNYKYENETGAYGGYTYGHLDRKPLPTPMIYCLDYEVLTRKELLTSLKNLDWYSRKYRKIVLFNECQRRLLEYLFYHRDVLKLIARREKRSILIRRDIRYLDHKLGEGYFYVYLKVKRDGTIMQWTKRSPIVRQWNGIIYETQGKGTKRHIVGLGRGEMAKLLQVVQPIYFHRFKGLKEQFSVGTDVFYLTEEQWRKKYIPKIKNKKLIEHVPWQYLKVINKYMKRKDIDRLITKEAMEFALMGAWLSPMAIMSNLLEYHMRMTINPELNFTYKVKRQHQWVTVIVNFKELIPAIVSHCIQKGIGIPILKTGKSYVRYHDEITANTQHNLDPEEEILQYDFEYKDDDIEVIPLIKVKDYDVEHEIMSHCVNSYVRDVKKGTMAVYHCQKPGDEYRNGFTVGLQKKSETRFLIFQQGGYCNSQPSKEFADIIRKTMAKRFKIVESSFHVEVPQGFNNEDDLPF